MTFKTLDEAIEYANDSVYGLTSSIHTTNTDTMMRAMNEIKFGETYVNREHFEASLRARLRCSSMQAAKPSSSTVSPFSSRISLVRSSGNP